MDTNTEHTCERCGHNATTKGNLLHHLKNVKECKTTNSTRSRKDIIDELTGDDLERRFECEFCHKKFTSSSSKCHHKLICKEKPVLTAQEQEHKEMKQTILNMQKEILTLHGILRGMNKQIITQGQEINHLNTIINKHEIEEDDNKDMSNIFVNIPVPTKTVLIKKIASNTPSTSNKASNKASTSNEATISNKASISNEASISNTPSTSNEATSPATTTNASTSKKKKKAKIPQALRTATWIEYIGEENSQAKCLCCKTAVISVFNFHCAHVISESKGGELNLENLRPVCTSCNLSMGMVSMEDFANSYFGNRNLSMV